ncbi:unnamed protein product, partial [Brenthis ino]
MDLSSMELVITTFCVLVTMVLLCCLCCLCMKLSDLKMRHYIVETAKKRGLNVEMEKLDPKYIEKSPSANENCTIIVPEVAIIL